MEALVISAVSLAPLTIFLLIAALNITTTQLRLSRTTARDCRRFRVALWTELHELQTLHRDNLVRLKAGEKFILSSRACMVVYKGNLGRLISIPDAEIASLVHAYAVSERAEHFIAATAKASGAMAFRLIENDTPVDQVVEEIERADRAICDAIASMRPPKEAGSAKARRRGTIATVP